MQEARTRSHASTLRMTSHSPASRQRPHSSVNLEPHVYAFFMRTPIHVFSDGRLFIFLFGPSHRKIHVCERRWSSYSLLQSFLRASDYGRSRSFFQRAVIKTSTRQHHCGSVGILRHGLHLLCEVRIPLLICEHPRPYVSKASHLLLYTITLNITTNHKGTPNNKYVIFMFVHSELEISE